MVVLLGIAFLAGLITALSPCVLPVLPIVLAGGASGSRRRPFAIVAGLVASFTFSVLAAAAVLEALGLPEDLLRNLAIALLFVVAVTVAFPRAAAVVERPLLFLTRRRPTNSAGGFALGLSLGLVFVPCAGPVLAAVSVLAARGEVGAQTVALTIAYAFGVALPLLGIGLGGQRAAAALRPRMATIRPVLGVTVALAAFAMAFGLDRRLQTLVPGYTEAFQERVERSTEAERELARLSSAGNDAPSESGGPASESYFPRWREGELGRFGLAPELVETTAWLNTPREAPLSLADLRGRVVVIDFWTYSCVNCLRTLPYLKAWDDAYRGDGLTILGVHAPEFAFERKQSNVRDAVADLGIRYPVVLDNDFGTWNAFSNQYWPAKYIVDRRGLVRFVHYGEGDYERTEAVIRTLLAEGGSPPTRRARARGGESASREPITPESYLGYERLARYAGIRPVPDRPAEYRFPSAPLPLDHVAYSGYWQVEGERIVAGLGARLRLRFHARDVHLVLGGRGRLEVFLDGRKLREVEVEGDRLYTLLRLPAARDGLLELRFPLGLSAYAFTFG